MSSVREVVRNQVVAGLLGDARDCMIFNEADMQVCAAQHLAVACGPELLVRNQPNFPVGQRRGTINTKPDIVLFNRRGLVGAVEFKCFLECERTPVGTMRDRIAHDVEKLRLFRARYPQSDNAFAIALVNVENRDEYAELQKAFSQAARQDWMRHYLFVHLINVFCDESGRKRRWYDDWRANWTSWKRLCEAAARREGMRQVA